MKSPCLIEGNISNKETGIMKRTKILIICLGVLALVLTGCAKPEVENVLAIPLKGAVLLNWTDPPAEKAKGLDHIEISFTPESGPAQPIIVPLEQQEFVIEGLEEGEEYVFTVKTAKAKGKPSKGVNPLMHDVYIGGYITNENSRTVAVYWKNGVQIALTEGNQKSAYSNAYVRDIAVAGSDVYMIGEDGESAVLWINGESTALPGDSAVVKSITIDGTDVYIAGSRRNRSRRNACYWKNGEGFDLPDDRYFEVGASDIAIVGTDVYIAGYGISSNFAYHPQFWKNGELVDFSTVQTGELKRIRVDGEDVYVGGWEYASRQRFATIWKNEEAIALSDGKIFATVEDFAVSGANVFAAGRAGQTAVYWKNGEEAALSNGEDEASANGLSLAGKYVFAAGYENSGTPVRGYNAYTDSYQNFPTSVAYLWAHGRAIPLGDGERKSIAYSVVVVPRPVEE
jgi:hypothetical protein